MLLSMGMKIKIAENIKFYRKQLGLTQGQLAEMLNEKSALFPTMKMVTARPIFSRCVNWQIFLTSL